MQICNKISEFFHLDKLSIFNFLKFIVNKIIEYIYI